MPQAAEKTVAASFEGNQLKLEYNQPLRVPPNFTAVAQTTQANSVLQIENLSSSNTLLYFVNAGSVLNENGEIPANTSDPKTWVENFNGATLNVSNISTRDAVALVTLRST